MSGGKLSSENSGIRKYTRNSSIRMTAVYGNDIEYDYKIKTDQMI